MTITYHGTGVTLGLYFAPTKGQGDTVGGGDWVDITSYVLDTIDLSRGRGSETDTFTAGTLRVRLLNTSRIFDPEYAAGTYYGQLLPGRPIKLEMTYSATTVVLFRGWVDGWPQGWDLSDNVATADVIAHDGFKPLAVAELPESRYSVVVLADTPTAWYRLGDTDDEAVCSDSSGNARHGKYPQDAELRGTLTDGLVTYSADGARAMTGQADTSKQLIATDLHYLSGTTFSWEAWLRVPEDFNTSGYNDVPMTIWAQSTNPLAFGVVTALTVEPILVAPSIRIRIVRSLTDNVLLGVQIADGTNTYEDRWNLYGRTLDGNRHHYMVTRNGATLKLYIDGVEITRTATSGTLTAGSATFGTYVWAGNLHRGDWVVDDMSLYSTTLNAATVLAHYAAGSTANSGEFIDQRIALVLSDSGITWITGSYEVSQIACRAADYTTAGGSTLGYLQNLEMSEQGRLFFASDGTLTFYANGHDIGSSVAAAFTDAGGSLAYAEAEYEYDDTRIVNDAKASRTNGDVQRYQDATSITAYGRRTRSLEGLQCRDDAVVASIATYVVGRYKDPAPRIRSLTVTPRTNVSGLMPVVRDLDIGDKVTFRRAPMAGTAYTKTLTVEGVSHSIAVTGDWRTTYLTAPADATAVALWDTGNGWDQAKWGI